MTDPYISQLQAQATVHKVEVDGCRVCWRQFGEGPPLVLLHGGHGSWLHWVRNIQALATHFTVWVPDLPGYGDSDELGPARSGDMMGLVQATLRSLDALVGPETWISLAGFSFGGLASALLAVQRGRIRHLILLGAAGHGGPRRPRGELMNWLRAKTQADLQTAMHHNLLMHMLFEASHIDALALQVHTLSCQQTRFRSRPISMAGGLSAALELIKAPVQLIWGEHDVTATPELLAQTLVQGHAQRKAIILPGAGHWVQYESADKINQLILNTLREKN